MTDIACSNSSSFHFFDDGALPLLKLLVEYHPFGSIVDYVRGPKAARGASVVGRGLMLTSLSKRTVKPSHGDPGDRSRAACVRAALTVWLPRVKSCTTPSRRCRFVPDVDSAPGCVRSRVPRSAGHSYDWPL